MLTLLRLFVITSLRHLCVCLRIAGGLDNQRRLTGNHETARWDTFSHAVAHRGSSIRIPRHVSQEQKGYFEDRRPASNMDPYQVSGVIVATVCLGETDDKLFAFD